MYSFTSTSDFDNKTGYVSDITHCADADTSSYFYPLEQIYEFDNLFTRFQSEIDDAINNSGTFDSGVLKIARLYELDSTGSGGAPALLNSYLCVRLSVGGNQISVYYGYSGYVNSHRDILYSDYLNGTPEYNTGRLHLVRFVDPDTTNGGVLSNRFISGLMLGNALVYSGRWEEPSYTYPHGKMSYTPGNSTIPSLIPVGNASQTGYPSDSTQRRMEQPEIIGYVFDQYYYTLSMYQLMFVDSSGEYDPNPPTPPGPPTPGTDPNQDPNDEPGDNPDPSPGPHTRDYDPIPVPPAPTVTSLGAGMCSLYVPTTAILNLLADEIFSDNIIQIIENIFNNPQDMIAGLSIVPFVVPVSGQYYHKVGRYTSSIAMQRAASQFVDIDCGSILVEHYHNNFLDYDPFTKLKIWLPYIGYQDLSVDDVMGCIVSVKYRCDILSGACVAFISTGLEGGVGAGAQRVIAQYSGNCAVQVPTAAQSYDNMVSTAVNILTTAGATAVGGGGALGVAAGLASSAANYVTSMKPDVKRNGTPGSTAGYMAVQKPYILRFTPRVSVPDDFIDLKGYASNRSGPLSSFYGYAEVESIKLENVYGTDSEIAEILSLLREGVFI